MNQKLNNTWQNMRLIEKIVIFLLLILAFIFIYYIYKALNQKGLYISKMQITIGESRKIADYIDTKKIIFESMNPQIVSVDNPGYVYGVQEGQTEIILKDNNHQTISKFTVTVRPVSVSDVVTNSSTRCSLSLYKGIVTAEIKGEALSYGFDKNSVNDLKSHEIAKSIVLDMDEKLQSEYQKLYNQTENNNNYQKYEKFYYENPKTIDIGILVNYYVKGIDNEISSCQLVVSTMYTCNKYAGREDYNVLKAKGKLLLPSPDATYGCYTKVNNFELKPLETDGELSFQNTRKESDCDSNNINWNVKTCNYVSKTNASNQYAPKYAIQKMKNNCYGDNYKRVERLHVCYDIIDSVSEIYQKEGIIKGYTKGYYKVGDMKDLRTNYDYLKEIKYVKEQ